MQRSQLIPYLVNLFSSGQPSGLDYKALIEGLGKDVDRPHLVCVSNTNNIPDNLLLTSEFTLSSAMTPGGGSGGSGSCGCPSIPMYGCGCGTGSNSSMLVSGSKKDTAINIMCDWFNEGWAMDCIGISGKLQAPRAYYWVLSKLPESNCYEILSAQFDNPGFDKGGFKSANCVRLVRWVYDRSQQAFVSGDARLVVTDLTGAVLSNQVRDIRVVTETPPKVEDNVLYIQVKLPTLQGFDVKLKDVTQTTATFTWDSVPHAIGYQYRIGKGGEWVSAMSPCTISGLQVGVEYLISFRALGDDVHYSNSEVVSHYFTTKQISQLPQVVLTATAGNTSCAVSWNPIEGAVSYAVKLGKTGAIHTVQNTSYMFQNLVQGQTYEAHVRAVSDSAEVLDSDWAKVEFTTRAR